MNIKEYIKQRLPEGSWIYKVARWIYKSVRRIYRGIYAVLRRIYRGIYAVLQRIYGGILRTYRFIHWIGYQIFSPNVWLARWQRALPFLTRSMFWITLLIYPVFCLLSWLRIFGRRLLGLKPAILWAPTPILTIAESSAIMRGLGYPSKTLVFTNYYITDNFDYNLKPLIHNPSVGGWLPNVLFLWALLKFDIFHFFYDGGLWSGMKIVPNAKWLELPLLRLAGKRIVASAYGADVRVKTLNDMWQPYNLCQECPEPGKHCICDAVSGATNTKYYREWCNALLAMGDMHDYVFDSRRDFNYWPIDVNKIAYVGVQPHAGMIAIVHSPNHRHFKGTRFIEAAVTALHSKGYDIKLIMVEGVSNSEAKRMYAEADIVFAQCIAGWVGYTEIEAMAAGKPVISFLRAPERYLEHSPGCPVVSANPDTLEQELEKLVRDSGLREELGRKGREYVENEWSYEALAPRYDALHQDVWTKNSFGKTLRAKWEDFFYGESAYRVGIPLEGSTLKEWPIIGRDSGRLGMRRIEWGIYGQPAFDSQGIPRMFYAGRYVEHPGVVALFALNAFHTLLLEPETLRHKTQFLNGARWLRDHLEIDGQGVGRWFYPFEAVGRKLGVPWISCFSQSLGISILLRAEQVSPGEGFRQQADAAIELFRIPIQDGGILWREDGKVYLEEYPENPPAHVLNGFITGMFGLHEYHRVAGLEWTQSLFAECVETLKEIIGQYETVDGLRYDLHTEIVVNPDYYYFIVQQLQALHQMTGERIFLDYAQRWSRQMYKKKLDLFFSGKAPL